LGFAVDDPEVSLDEDQDVLGDLDEMFSQVGVLFGSI
jgi:hypothetical protein